MDKPLGSGADSTRFNKESLDSIEKVALDLRERLIENSHQLIWRAYFEDFRNSIPIREAFADIDRGDPLNQDQQDYLSRLERQGMPKYLQSHHPAFEEFQVGSEFVGAVSCRLVEVLFIDTDAQFYTSPDLWPAGREMIISMPVKTSVDEEYDEDEARPEPSSDDIFIKDIRRLNGALEEPVSTLYAIGKSYCYKYHPIGDIEAHMDFIMKDPSVAAEFIQFENLKHQQLADFLTSMIDMARWPIKTYWPGVNASPINR